MEYRVLGKTGLRVSVLAYGGSPLGGVFGPVDQAQCTEAVRTALDHGINFFDTAPYYGATRAEAVLGRALVGVERSRFVLATKVGRYGVDSFDFSADRIRRSVDESLERLGVEYVDLIQVHDVEFGSLEQIAAETIPALHEICAAGKARFIGISGLPLATLDALAKRSVVDCIQSYCHGTLFDASLSRWLPAWSARRLGCINSAPLGMGLLTEQGPPSWHPAPDTLRQACRDALSLCRRRGASLPDLALHYSTHLPGVHCTVVGMSSAREVLNNVRAFDTTPDPALVQNIFEVLAHAREVTWPSGRRESFPCT